MKKFISLLISTLIFIFISNYSVAKTEVKPHEIIIQNNFINHFNTTDFIFIEKIPQETMKIDFGNITNDFYIFDLNFLVINLEKRKYYKGLSSGGLSDSQS